MFKKLVKNKIRAFEKATQIIQTLHSEYQRDIQKKYGDKLNDKFIGLNAFDITKYLFESQTYYEYVKYAELAKTYDRKITSIKSSIILFFVIPSICLMIFLRPLLLSGLIAILLIGVMSIILKKLGSGESYGSFYRRTLLSFLVGAYPGLKFTKTKNIVTKYDISNVVGISFDETKLINNINFESNNSQGNITDLELYDITTYVDEDGHVRKTRTKIFDGFYLRALINQKSTLLKGNIIKIRADENILSHIAEDTVKSMYENEKELSFNSEEMNKSFDARISGYEGFASVDEALIAARQIITPTFEKHLLYLRSRYNTFNMNISDDKIEFCVNMSRNLLQMVKHKELFELKRTYRDVNEQFKMLDKDLLGISDFAYYKIFPFMERLYLINYLTYLYLSYMHHDTYYAINNDEIDSFEREMEEVYKMAHSDFKKLYIEKIEKIKDETKNFALVFEKEER